MFDVRCSHHDVHEHLLWDSCSSELDSSRPWSWGTSRPKPRPWGLALPRPCLDLGIGGQGAKFFSLSLALKIKPLTLAFKAKSLSLTLMVLTVCLMWVCYVRMMSRSCSMRTRRWRPSLCPWLLRPCLYVWCCWASLLCTSDVQELQYENASLKAKLAELTAAQKYEKESSDRKLG